MATQFDAEAREAFAQQEEVRVRTGEHRFIPIWTVVVNGRVFARSWQQREDGWAAALARSEPGEVKVNGEPRPVEALVVGTEDRALTNAIDQAYRDKYDDAWHEYVVRLTDDDAQATTLELLEVG